MLTERKRKYAQARQNGSNQTEAAIKAGCPAKTAAQAGSRYEKDPDVTAYLKRMESHGEPKVIVTQPTGNKGKSKVMAKVEHGDEYLEVKPPRTSDKPPPRNDNDEWIDDPLEYLKRVMNSPMEDPRLRADAAKTLMPFIHARKGESGKKEEKQGKARNVASKFSVSAPPKLRAIG